MSKQNAGKHKTNRQYQGFDDPKELLSQIIEDNPNANDATLQIIFEQAVRDNTNSGCKEPIAKFWFNDNFAAYKAAFPEVSDQELVEYMVARLTHVH